MKIALLGAGARGFELARQVRRQAPWAELAAVAEPDPVRRARFAAEFGLGPAACFDGWRALLEDGAGCSAAIVATMDREHRGPVEAALARGWHLLLEKPLAPTLDDCEAMAAAWRRRPSVVAVCHSLRHHPAFSRAKAWLDAGRVGRLLSLDLLEQVGYWHFAHSFVRGNWRRQDESAPSLLAKSCHDLDLIQWLAGAPCEGLSSEGALSHFGPAAAPEGAAERCDAPCRVAACPYDARRLYGPGGPCRDFARTAAELRGLGEDEAAAALVAGREGRCVYRCDNDVADHQSVLLRFAGGLCATFTLSAFTVPCARRLRLQGSEGQLEVDETETGQRLRLRRFDGGSEELFLQRLPGSHGGADARLVGNWLAAVRDGRPDAVLTGMEESLAGHRLVFAAERSRLEGRRVDLKSADDEAGAQPVAAGLGLP